MQSVKTDRKIKFNKKYQPIVTESDEIYINGFFHFNISQIIKDIDSKKAYCSIIKNQLEVLAQRPSS